MFDEFWNNKKGRNKTVENLNSARSRWMKGFDENNFLTILNKQPYRVARINQ